MNRAVLRFTLFPLLGYIACYFILTFPLVLSWKSGYFCDKGDGPSTIWNVWWVNYSITHLHQLPWHTNMLFYPDGVTLLLHSLSPINGILSIPLRIFLPQVQVYNTLITLAFALSGLTAFWLAYDLTGAYWPSLAAGYAFTFSSLHFAHAPGHLHQITTEFLPLFLMLWLRLLRNPSIIFGIFAALAMFLVLLSDHYFFLFAAMAALIVLIWMLIFDRDYIEWRRFAISLATFIFVSAITSGVLIAATIFASRQPLAGTHDPQFFSADLVNLFVPGWSWCFHSLTRTIWEPIGSYNETSVSIGLAILVAAGYACARRSPLNFTTTNLWMILAILFAILALGPTLRVLNKPVTDLMPYRVLEMALPQLKTGGCPARMMVITQLSCAILAAAGLNALSQRQTLSRNIIAAVFVILMVIESEPRLQVVFPAESPRWVEFLRDDPQQGGVIDLASLGDAMSMYYQTLHTRPIPSGYISRVPTQLESERQKIVESFNADRFEQFSRYGFIFLAISATHAPLPFEIAYHDSGVTVYRLMKN